MAWLVGALEAQASQWFVLGVVRPAFLVEVGILQQDLVTSSSEWREEVADVCFAGL